MRFKAFTAWVVMACLSGAEMAHVCCKVLVDLKESGQDRFSTLWEMRGIGE